MSVTESPPPVEVMGAAIDAFSAAPQYSGILSISQSGATARFGLMGHLSSAVLNELAVAFSLADAADGVVGVSMTVDSETGEVDGVLEAIDSMRSCRKPIEANCMRACGPAFLTTIAADLVCAHSIYGTLGGVQRLRIGGKRAVDKMPMVHSHHLALVRELRPAIDRGIIRRLSQGATFNAERAEAAGLIDTILTW